jgi:hypothetical protein
MPRTPEQLNLCRKRDRAKRRAFVTAGLRTDGKPRVAPKPCGCKSPACCVKCAKPGNKRIVAKEKIAEMYALYQSGMTFADLSRKYDRERGTIRGLFEVRGLALRPAKKPKLGFGVRIPEPTIAELEALAAAAPRLYVPPELKIHWRRWDFTKRREFIAMLRKKFPSKRPTGKFSSNVTPFEYGTPEAHKIADKMNEGRNSQTKLIAMKPCSEGVIYKGELYFWASKTLYLRGTGWRPGIGRQPLKHVIWEEANGRPVPEKTIVIQKDGNLNNFLPSNLALLSMAENALRNSVCERLRKDPQNPELHRKLKLRGERIWNTRTRNNIRAARATAAALVQQFRGKHSDLVSTLTRRSS